MKKNKKHIFFKISFDIKNNNKLIITVYHLDKEKFKKRKISFDTGQHKLKTIMLIRKKIIEMISELVNDDIDDIFHC